MPKHPWIEYPLIILATIGPLAVIVLRLTIKKKVTNANGTVEERPLGIGVRVIELIGLLVLVPAVAILGLEGVISGEGTGTLLGVVVGYALSGITSPVPD